MIVGGIFGPKKSGKTTLAQHLSVEYWNAENRRTLVFDPNFSAWGETCWVGQNEADFWRVVWSTQNCLIICDDAASSINRDSDLVDVFTRINHNGHKLLIIGHGGRNLLPVMREQMDTLYLFKCSPKQADTWYEEVWSDEEILKQAPTLGQYEFLLIRQYQTCVKMKLDLKKVSEEKPTVGTENA